MLREQLGPNMARTIVGDAYDPDYNYFLDTDEGGLHLTIVNKINGDSRHIDLGDTQEKAEEHEDALHLDTKTEGNGILKAALFGILVVIACIGFIAVGIIIAKVST